MSISQHIAGIRSRTSAAQSRLSVSEQDEFNNSQGNDDTNQHQARGDQNDLAHKLEAAKLVDGSQVSNDPQPVPFTSLDQIDYIHDFGDKLQQMKTLERLEQQWTNLNSNLAATMNHLQEDSYQVTQSSKACLNALKNSVEISCDKIDDELKVFFHLMTKCDELTTKLSIANSFRDEIRTLRKSVETLEQLYKK